jgi:putative hemin transport protein
MTATTAPTADPQDLLARFEAMRARAPGPVRARDAADALGVSEGALTEARRGAGEAVPLRGSEGAEGLAAIVAGLPAVGEALALTRNASCVHEKTGVYATPTHHGAMAQTLGEIDLRLFLSQWRRAYALTEETPHSGRRASIQVFDRHGDAVHKVYPTEGTDPAAFDALIARHAAPDAAPARFEPAPPPASAHPDERIDVAALRADWAALEHSHAFHGMLGRRGVTRLQAMRLGGPDFARPLDPGAAAQALEGAATGGTPLMIFVGNRGCVQIHSGSVEIVKTTGPWLNVLDPRFNLHLRWDRIATAWLVRKPSVHGDVHSVELFDAEGFCFCQIFGERPPGGTERADWRALADALPPLESETAP